MLNPEMCTSSLLISLILQRRSDEVIRMNGICHKLLELNYLNVRTIGRKSEDPAQHDYGTSPPLRLTGGHATAR